MSSVSNMKCLRCGKDIVIRHGQRKTGRMFCDSRCRRRKTDAVSSLGASDTLRADVVLDQLVSRETMMPWERHPIPWTNVRSAKQ